MKLKPLPALCTLALLAPSIQAAETDYNFGGMIKAMVIADSDQSGFGANIPAHLLPLAPSQEGGVALDTTLSRLNFVTDTLLSSGDSIKSKIEVDFNNSNNGEMNLRLREAYVSWSMGNGTLLAGQTWSTLMDMRNVPMSLSEPVLSGVAFMRQPMIRWSQSFDSFGYSVALEDGTNSTIQYSRDIDAPIDSTSSLPDLHAAIETVHDLGWARAAGMLNQVKTKVGTEEHKETGYAFELSGGVNLSASDLFTLLYVEGEGNERYFLGISGGPIYNEADDNLELRRSRGVMASYNRSWRHDLTSVFAYGVLASEGNNLSRIQETIDTAYSFANINWQVRENLYLGAEYSYGKYQSNLHESLDNHRLFLAADYRF